MPRMPFDFTGYRVVVTYSPGNTKHREWVAGMKGVTAFRGHAQFESPTEIRVGATLRWRRNFSTSLSKCTGNSSQPYDSAAHYFPMHFLLV